MCCSAGNEDEYSAAKLNTFPTQAFINRISKYTDKVYVTTEYVKNGSPNFRDMNGIVVVSSGTDGVKVTCSNNDTLLKDTEWFKQNRTTPTEWAA